MRFVGLVLAVALTGLAACDKKADAPATAAAATTAVPAGTHWLDVAAATPDGGFRLGNPDAPVKLVEYASLTCPHCRDFHDESDADLRAKYIATGKVSYEYRNFLLNGPDLAASVLARCQGPKQFFNLMNAFYAAQREWVDPFMKMTPEDSKRIGALPQDQQAGAIARVGGLDAFMKARGMTTAEFDKCLANGDATKQLTAMRDTATNKLEINSTPSFIINGVRQEDIHTWSLLEPKLQTALQ